MGEKHLKLRLPTQLTMIVLAVKIELILTSFAVSDRL
jgi:hypothetical protein